MRDSTKRYRVRGDIYTKNFLDDDSGVNVIIEYLLNLTILIVLFTVVLLTYQNVMSQSSDTIAKSEYNVYANDIANRIVAFDRIASSTMAQGGSVSNLNTTFTTPAQIVGRSFDIRVSGDPSDKNVGIYTLDGTLVVKAGLNTTLPVNTKTLYANSFHTIIIKDDKIEVT